MDKLKKYQAAILKILEDYKDVKYSNLDAVNVLIADKENHHYQILTIGWEGKKHVHHCPMHFDIINGKIWIQKNMTEIDVGQKLVEQNIPKTDIVLGFLRPKMREYSEYAIA